MNGHVNGAAPKLWPRDLPDADAVYARRRVEREAWKRAKIEEE